MRTSLSTLILLALLAGSPLPGCDGAGGSAADAGADATTDTANDATADTDAPRDVADGGADGAGGDVSARDVSAGDAPPVDVGPGDVEPWPDGGSVGDETPILDRPSRGRWACRVERERTDHTPAAWDSSGHALAVLADGAADGAAWFARVESTAPDPFSPGTAPAFLVSPLAADGTFGAPVTPSAGDPATIDGPALAPRGDGVAVVWIEAGQLRFAALDGGVATVVAPRAIDGAAADAFARPQLAAGPDGGFGLVFAPQETEMGPRDVRFVALDADGTPRGAVRVIAEGQGAHYPPAPAVSADAAGYALAWRDRDGTDGRVRFAATDAHGDERIAPRTVAAGELVGASAGFDGPHVALLAVGGGYLVGWTVARYGDHATATGGGATIHVARLDGAGDLAAPIVPLRVPEDSVDEVEPAFLPFGADAVAVLWGRGDHIYICAGCVPNTRLDLVLVDPVDLVPLSDVATLPNGASDRAGGLLSRADAVLGATILTTFQVTYHVHSTPGSAAFLCAPTAN